MHNLKRTVCCVASVLAIFASVTSLCHGQQDDGIRTWKDASGAFSIKAKLIRRNKTHVQLETDAGKKIAVEIKKLSKDDLDFLLNLEGRTKPIGRVEGDITSEKEVETIGNIKLLSEFDALKSTSNGFEKIELPKFDLSSKKIISNRNKTFVIYNGGKNRIDENAFYIDTIAGKTGRLNAVEIGGSPVSLSPSGRSLLVERRHGGVNDSNLEVGVIQLGDRGAQLFSAWDSRVGGGFFDAKSVSQFVDEELVIIRNGKTNVIRVWDWKQAKSLWKATIASESRPAISFNGKQIAFLQDDSLMVVESRSGSVVARLPLLIRGAKYLKFSPDGKKIAAFGTRLLRVIDLTEPNQTFDSSAMLSLVLMSIRERCRFWWIDENYIQIGRLTYDFRSGQIVDIPFDNSLFGTDPITEIPLGNGIVARISGKDEPHLIFETHPRKWALKMVDKPRYVINRGDSIKVEVYIKDTPEGTKELLHNQIEKQLAESGLRVSADSKKRLVLKLAWGAKSVTAGKRFRFPGLKPDDVASKLGGHTENIQIGDKYVSSQNSGYYVDGKFWMGVRIDTASSRRVFKENGKSYQPFPVQVVIAGRILDSSHLSRLNGKTKEF